MDMLMHQERVRTHVGRLHHEMQESVYPVEIPEEEVESTGYGRGEIEQNVGEHHHIRIHSDYRLGEADIRSHHPSIEERLPFYLVVVAIREHSRLKVRILRVIQAIERRQGRLISDLFYRPCISVCRKTGPDCFTYQIAHLL